MASLASLVQLTEDAVQDLSEIYDYLGHHHSPAKANDGEYPRRRRLQVGIHSRSKRLLQRRLLQA